MKNRLPARRGLGPVALVSITLLVLIVGGAGTVGALQYFGVIDVARWFRGPMRDTHAGMVPVPVAVNPIPAYSRISRDDFHDVQANGIKCMYMRPEEVNKDWITDISKIVNRVTAKDKRPGYVFTESDFLPKGTRPGLVGGIPPGKRAMIVDANKIQGLKDLSIGDHFDLVATAEVDLKGMQPLVRWKVGPKSPFAGVGTGSGGKSSSVTVLVDNGVVVTRPVVAKAAPNPGSSNTVNSLATGNEPSKSNKNDPKDMTIALALDEIPPTTEALATKMTLFCVARSGNPEDNADTKIPEQDPLENVSVIETIRGKHFAMEAFPIAGDKPVVSDKAKAANKPATAAPATIPAPATTLHPVNGPMAYSGNRSAGSLPAQLP